jgi:ectoine hydroxylase-related dioxygenase (phytanoyl-CoA dioxygenase family)
MTQTAASQDHLTTAQTLDPALVDAYRRDGFVKVPRVLTAQQAARFREAALQAAGRMQKMEYAGSVFDQLVNVWRQDDTLRELTLHPGIGQIAQRLADQRLRLWHDQVLIKRPRNSKPTEFHQDQPYWPHRDSPGPISCWVALCDVPVERGCMTFIPGYQHRDDLEEQDLQRPESMFEICPELTWARRVTHPLRAGDCTFHHGRAPHMATPNLTDEPRVAHVMIYISRETRFSGERGHVVTDTLDLTPGDRLEGELFPEVDAMGVAG